MDESYAGKAVAEPKKSESAEPEGEADEDGESASEILVDKNKLPKGAKEGDTCTFRIRKDFGDEVSLEPVAESEPAAEPMTTERDEIAALDTEDK